MRKVDFLETINDSWCEKMGVSIVAKIPPHLFDENKIFDESKIDEDRKNESCMVFPRKSNILHFFICLLDFNSLNEVEDYITKFINSWELITKRIKSWDK